MDSNNNVKVSSMVRYTIFVFLIGVLVTLIGFMVYFRLISHSEFLSEKQWQYYKDLDDKYGEYYQLESAIRTNSIYDVNSKRMNSNIIKSITGSVDDKYIEFYTPEEYEKFNKAISGTYTGIGAAITEKKPGVISISRVIEDGPAAKSDLREGDVLLKIDGKAPKDGADAYKLVTGEVGTEVKLQIGRGDEKFNVTLVRAEVEDITVYSELYDTADGIGYIQIRSFKEGTADEFETQIKGLIKDGCSRIIVDLRNNGGGVMAEGLKVADTLLPACKIMTSIDASGKETVYNSDESCVDAKIVVLVNKDTASASEILAGAIQCNDGGMLIGEKTYGKGLIQGLFKLRDGSRIKLTTNKYLLPNGKCIDGKGITPDLTVKSSEAMSAAVLELLKS